MTQQEFEARVGYKVSEVEYHNIEDMYMATDLDKDTFCKEYKKHKDSLLVNNLFFNLKIIKDKNKDFNECQKATEEIINNLDNKIKMLIEACELKDTAIRGYQKNESNEQSSKEQAEKRALKYEVENMQLRKAVKAFEDLMSFYRIEKSRKN